MIKIEEVLKDLTEDFRRIAKEDLEIMNSGLDYRFRLKDIDLFIDKKIKRVNSLIIKDINKKFNFNYRIVKNFGKFVVIDLGTKETHKLSIEIESYIDCSYSLKLS